MYSYILRTPSLAPIPPLFDAIFRHLQVDVAKRSTLSVNNIPNSIALSKHTHLQHISQETITRWRLVHHVDGTSNRISRETGIEVLVLPDPPRAIDLSMVKPERRVSRGDEEVSAWVAADGVVPCGVHAEEAVLEHDAVDGALHVILEGGDFIVLCNQIHALLVGGELLGQPLRDVAADAARLVTEVVPGDDAFGAQGWGEGRDIGGEFTLGEGTGFDAAAAASRWDAVDASCEGVSAVVLGVDAIARHGVGGAVEHWGGQWVGGGFAPIPVLRDR